MEERLPRKLAVILHADVVGSTTLVQKDESLAHARIQDAFRRFSLTIEAYSGVTHELRGDALVAEFARASDAISAALVFQIENTESNARLEDNLQPRLRIGISLGEVVIADNTVTGAGVVLAQRVEQLAEPGGVCITGAIHEAAPQHLPLDYSDLGKREAKGFEEPVQVYSASVRAGKQIPSPELAVSAQVHSRKPKRLWTASAIALLIFVGGVLAWWQPWVPKEEPASVERMAFPLPDKPSIAVLPFTNMSDDPKQEYFVDGMTDALITGLSKLSSLFVIARNSVFTYKGKSVKVAQVAEELGVRYVLQGSVQRAGEQVRINAQLIDTTTGWQQWAEQYDGAMTDVFALQDKVTQKIVAELAVTLTADEEALRTQKETNNLEAYDAFLAGWERYRLNARDDFIKAIPHFERALELDPSYGRAHAALAAIYIESWWNTWRVTDGGNPEAIRRARKHLQEATKHPTPLAHRVASFLHVIANQYEDALAEAERAIDLDPNDPNGYEAMAWLLIHLGRPAESLDFITRAERLDPQSSYLYRVGEAQFHLERYEDVVTAMMKFSKSHPDSYFPLLYLASAYGHLGQEPEAKSAWETYKKIRVSLEASFPGSNALAQVAIYYFKDGGGEEKRLREGLRRAGFDVPPEIVDASSEGITLKRPADGAVARVYDAAKQHCLEHGKKSIFMSSLYPSYTFDCR